MARLFDSIRLVSRSLGRLFLTTPSRPPSVTKPRRNRHRPIVEMLEDRLAPAISTLATFVPFPNGAFPVAGVVEDSSGNLFGTSSGGTGGYGTVFEVTAGSGTITTLASFNGTNGGSPNGVVEDSRGNLFGTADVGGASGNGTVFELAAGSGTITNLASFNNTNGAFPVAGLLEDRSGNLFGTTSQGGANGDGTLFELAAGSGTITTLVSFNITNGANPQARLVEDSSGNFFGTTSQGGAYSSGTVFELVAGSGMITTLACFNTGAAYPQTGLVEDSSGNLFGITTNGGGLGYGTVFELAAGSGTITTLAAFNYANGKAPLGGLVEDGSGNLFGTSSQGGANGNGTVFELAAGSGTITALASFNGTNGDNPQAGLIEDSRGNLFGTAYQGGASGIGSVFEVAAGSGTITALASFKNPNAANPSGGLIEDSSGNLFGTSSEGGSSNMGSVFEVAAGSGSITVLASFNFNSTNAAQPAGLVEDRSGNLFGTTGNGGARGLGTVFEVAAGSGTAATLASFDGSNGAHPDGGVIEDGNGNLFGTSSGSGSGFGTVFEVAAGSGTITTLASFNITNGAFPVAGLVEDHSGNLFGTTSQGGANGDGTVFEVTAGSGTITTLASFNGTNGPNSYTGLVEDSSGNLFGTTAHGGVNGKGTVFELAAGSGTIITLASFNNTSSNESVGPSGLVEDSRGNLFGVTAIGGTNGYGTVFEVAAGSGTITTLASFSNSNGANPNGVVEDSGGNLFGVTGTGGAAGVGTVFEVAANTPPSVITPASANPNPVMGTSTALSVLGADSAGESTLAYTWAVTAGPSGVTFSVNASNAAKNTTATFTKAGAYTIRATITDAGGLSVTSNVIVTVAQTLTSIAVTPVNPTVKTGATQQFAATPVDQFGQALTTQPGLTWDLAAGAGTIGAAGLYTAPATAGSAVVRASATVNGVTKSGTSNVTVTAPAAFAAHINFQDTTSQGFPGYLVDTGLVFADRGNGLSYGWNANTTADARNRNAPNSPDERYDTFIHMQKPDNPNAFWEIAVPNGTYTVHLAAGDPSNIDSVYKINVEGVLAVNGTPTSAQHWIENTVTVTVDDGRLTISSAAGSGNDKIDYIDITSVNLAPTVATAAAASSNPVSGTTTNLSVLGTDDGGEANLTYTWATTGTPPAPVTFSVNGTNAAKNTTATFTQSGTYNFQVTITDAGGLTTTSSVSVLVSTPALFIAHINFTSDPTEVPTGYVDDTGLAYGNRGNGLTYGWSADNTANARDRESSLSPDELHDSLIHMQTPSNPSQKFTWSIAVPNGTYTVHAVVGDPSNTDIVSKLTVNGVPTINGSTSSSTHWLEGTTTLTVTTGQLSVGEQAGAYDKIDFIDITEGSPEMLAGLPIANSHAAPLSQVQLQRVVALAIVDWTATGLNSAQLSALQHAQFVITDLSGGLLGDTIGNVIYIDRNAAGYGWSLGRHVAPHQIDLLTGVSHELGHELGLPDLDTQTNPGNVMDGTLAPGGRGLASTTVKGIEWLW